MTSRCGSAQQRRTGDYAQHATTRAAGTHYGTGRGRSPGRFTGGNSSRPELFHAPGEVFEIRVLDVPTRRSPGNVRRLFQRLRYCSASGSALLGKAAGVYVVMNEIDPPTGKTSQRQLNGQLKQDSMVTFCYVMARIVVSKSLKNMVDLNGMEPLAFSLQIQLRRHTCNSK